MVDGPGGASHLPGENLTGADQASTDSELHRPGHGFEALDRAALWMERPVRALAGSNRLNPLPHAGTISVFLLFVVVVSGLYITLFFEFGFEASYTSVQSMQGHAIQRVIRAVHRYSSAALVLTTVVHGWRILASRRFTGHKRRWRWASGVTSLLLVWVAGVSGYWLVWDRRAQAISEIVIGLVGGSGWGVGLAVNQLSGTGEGSGSGILLTIWFVHLGVTAVIGWFIFRHLRRSKMTWLPPRHWMGLMGGSLLIVSLLLPLGMLDPASSERLISDIPLDPFVLFLLPPLLSSAGWMVVWAGLVIAAVLLGLAKLLDRHDEPIISIDEEACTGCELCVFDCPYDALTMVPRGGLSLAEIDPEQGKHAFVAQVEPTACVSCGLCVGSCAFGAIDLPGLISRQPQDVEGKRVLVACERHLASSTFDSDQVVVGVRCAGALAPSGIRALMEEGATEVQLVGCAPNDCRYGIGNTLASERMAGARAPHLARRWKLNVSQDWVAPTELSSAVANPGAHEAVDASSLPKKSETLVGVGIFVLLSVVATGFATRAPFAGASEVSGVRVVLEHEAGRPIENTGEVFGVVNQLELVIDGEEQPRGAKGGAVVQQGQFSRGVLDWEIPPGSAEVELLVVGEAGIQVVLAESVTFVAGERLMIVVRDVPVSPGARKGEEVFNSRAAGCTVCHSIEPGDDGVGPSLAGVATRAVERVEGLDAEQYLRQSILLPDQYIVDGFRSGQMLPIYREALSEAELEGLLAYLLTLEDQPQDLANQTEGEDE